MEAKKREWFLKFGSGVVIVILWIVYVWQKGQNPNGSYGVFIAINIVLTLLGLALVFWKRIRQIFRKEDSSIPDPLNEEQIWEVINKEAEKRWSNINLEQPVEWEITRLINKNIIYAKKVNLTPKKEKLIIIINANYPNIKPTIPPLEMNGNPIDKDMYYINNLMNAIALNPFEEPDIIRKKLTVDQFNRPTEETEEIKQKPKKEEKEPVA